MHICSELTGTISHCSSFPIDVFLANQSPGTGHKPKSHLFKTDYFAGKLFALLQLSKTGFGWCKTYFISSGSKGRIYPMYCTALESQSR